MKYLHKNVIQRDMGTGIVLEDASLVTISGNTVTDWGKDAKAFDLPLGGVKIEGNLVDEG